jgi:5'-nucleotidase
MKILLTNDDGYKAENINCLYQELVKDHEVWMIAPKNNCSGMSAAISFLKETEIEKVSDKIYSVDGTPADCAYFGLLGMVDFEFDIVISGINHGANIGIMFYILELLAQPSEVESSNTLQLHYQ